ncbi:MAG: hypothetical protein HQK61_06740 [Desulfamplus sp.]|nr:hypothetical protein [Desulfamplus sp.]
MIKICSITCPQESADMVAQCYSSLPSQEGGKIRLVDTYVYTEGVTQGDKEYKAFSIFEFDDADEALVHKYLESRFSAFSKIPGVTYKIEDWGRVEDALKLLSDGNFDANLIFSTSL